MDPEPFVSRLLDDEGLTGELAGASAERLVAWLAGRAERLAAGGDQLGPVRVYFTTPDRPPEQSAIVAALVSHIRQAEHAIDVCAFELDNQAVTDALVAAAKQGVRVRLVTETDYLDAGGVQA